MWLLCAFGSALFAGITSILAKTGIKNTDSTAATAIRTVIILIFSWIMVFIAGVYRPISELSGNALLFLLLSGLSTGGSWLCYFKALQLGDVNKVTPVDKSSTVLTMLLAAVFLGEPLGLLKIICILLIGIGTLLMISKKETEEKESRSSWIVYALLSAVFASLTSIFGKIGVGGINSTLATALRTIVVLISAWAMVFITGKQAALKDISAKSMLFICLSGITTGLSWLCYYRALQDGEAGIVVPIDKLSIVITVIFSYFILKEKITPKALFGLILIVTGTLLLLV